MNKLIELSIEDSVIEISYHENPELYEEIDFKLYFLNILNFEDNEAQQKFVLRDLADQTQIASIVRNSIKFFDGLDVKYTLDKNTSKLLEASDDSDDQLRNSIKNWNDLSHSDDTKLVIPNFVRILKPYQERSVLHGLTLDHSANFSVPGSGKTTITYAIFSVLKSKGKLDKIVVIGPSSSFMPWEEEYEGCFGIRPNSLRVKSSSLSTLEEDFEQSDLTMLTYQMASNISPHLVQIMVKSNVMLVVDESHNIKRFGGGMWSTTLLKIAPYAKKRMILTGTPMPNDLRDLWSQFTFLWPFRNLMRTPSEYKTMIKMENSMGRIRELINPFYSRITKGDLDLPSPNFIRVYVPMGKVQKSVYNAIATKTLADLSVPISDKVYLTTWRRNKIIRLLQVASNPELLTQNSVEFKIPPMDSDELPLRTLLANYSDFEIPSKIAETVKLTQNLLDSGKKVLIWTSFVHNIRTLETIKPFLVSVKKPN